MTDIVRTGATTFTYANTGLDLSTTADTGTITAGYLYQKYSGTSMSSAQVAGVLAIALETYPTLTQAEAKSYILNYSKVDKMYETLGGFNDTTSLQGGENKFLFYNKERQDSGNTFPKTNYKIRPTSGNVFPRPKIRRR
jgi:subtilisin family serine protease